MRSIDGVGITPPKVLGTPKPASSVMISSTFGAPFGGATRGAHHGLDCSASFLMTPPNFGSGGGSCLPLMVVVASGEPSVPVTCCARAGLEPDMSAAKKNIIVVVSRASFMLRASHYVYQCCGNGCPLLPSAIQKLNRAELSF